MKSSVLLSIIVFLLTMLQMQGQRNITTLSGQKIRILQNGTWQKSDDAETKIDSSGAAIPPENTDDNTSKTNSESNNITQGGIKSIIAQAEKKEVETFLLFDILDKEVAMKEVQLSQARQLKNKESETTLKNEIADLRNKQKTAEKIYKIDAENVKKAISLKKLKDVELSKAMTDLGQSLNINVTPYLPVAIPTLPKTIEVNPAPNTPIKKKDVCLFARDEKINKVRITETNTEPFYTFTPEKLKNYFKEKELMDVYTSVIRKGKEYFFHITIKITSKDAAKNYGHISKESMMRVQFITGNSINLYCSEDVYGGTETYTGNIVFKAEYSINNENVKMLSKFPIDKVGIMWTSGFETYDIYNVDLIMNHLSCLKKI